MSVRSRALLVCAIILLGSVQGAVPRAHCTEAREGYRFIQFVRDGRPEERRLSLTAQDFGLRPGAHENHSYIGCLECPPKVGVGVIWLRPEAGFVAAEAGPKALLQRYWPQALGFLGRDEPILPTGSSRELNIDGLHGSAVEYEQSTRQTPIGKLVLFSIKDECVAVAGVIFSEREEGAVRFEAIADMLMGMRIEVVEPGSTDRLDRGPGSPPRLSPSAPLKLWSPERFTLEEVRRALATKR